MKEAIDKVLKYVDKVQLEKENNDTYSASIFYNGMHRKCFNVSIVKLFQDLYESHIKRGEDDY